jgi:hypothetical protein
VRGAALALAVIAACYSPSLPAGEPCVTDESCPIGQLCAGGRCSETGQPPHDAGCAPVSDPQVADEDGDHLADSCDPCPVIAGGATVDTDGDGLPDVCDPNLGAPSHPADSAWLFDGFRTQPAWAASGGWVEASDHNSLQVTAPGAITDDEREIILPLSRSGRAFDDFRVSASIRVSATIGTFGPEIGLQILDELTTESVNCTISQDFGDVTARFFGVNDDGALDAGGPFAWKENTDYTLELVRHGTSYLCRVTGSANDPTPATGTSPVTARSGNAVRIWAFGMTASINWVYVVGSP